MNSPLLDELELWIKRTRLVPDEDVRELTPEEAKRYYAKYGHYDLVMGPFGIRRLEQPWTAGGGGQ